MADQGQVKRLKQSANQQNEMRKWNQWRSKHPKILIDLRGVDLSGVRLKEADLSGADLRETNLIWADLSGTDLTEADLTSANLGGAHLVDTNLTSANLSRADLSGADLSGANLSGAEFRGAHLSGAEFRGAHLYEVNFASACFDLTSFASVDLSGVRGLERTEHRGPSYIGTHSVTLPQDPLVRQHFLDGAGFTADYIQSLTVQPIEYDSCFISYTEQDKAFARSLHLDLIHHNIRCWYAPHNLKPGDSYRHKIDASIGVHNKLVLILSKHSIESDWVQKEVEHVLQKEVALDMTRQVLFPLRLDNAAMTSNKPWVKSLRSLHHIADFTHWQEHVSYQANLARFLDGLKAVRLPMSPHS